MSEIEFDQEDQAILEALECLDDPESLSAGTPLNEETRGYVETLGLLPLALDPARPSSAVRRELLARVAAREETHSAASSGAGAGQGASVVQFPGPPPAPPPAAARSSASFLRLAAAAMLAVSLLGLGYLFGKTEEQGSTIARLEQELRDRQVRAEVREFSQADFDQLEERFRMVTEVARRAYPMHLTSEAERAGGPPTNGTIFVCGQHQRWYMNVRGLEPPPPEHEYHLWFVTEDGMIDGGAVELKGDRAELDAMAMPLGTSGFALTLETIGPHLEPEGELVLIADQSVSL